MSSALVEACRLQTRRIQAVPVALLLFSLYKKDAASQSQGGRFLLRSRLPIIRALPILSDINVRYAFRILGALKEAEVSPAPVTQRRLFHHHLLGLHYGFARPTVYEPVTGFFIITFLEIAKVCRVVRIQRNDARVRLKDKNSLSRGYSGCAIITHCTFTIFRGAYSRDDTGAVITFDGFIINDNAFFRRFPLLPESGCTVSVTSCISFPLGFSLPRLRIAAAISSLSNVSNPLSSGIVASFSCLRLCRYRIAKNNFG